LEQRSDLETLRGFSYRHIRVGEATKQVVRVPLACIDRIFNLLLGALTVNMQVADKMMIFATVIGPIRPIGLISLDADETFPHLLSFLTCLCR
jgi:hypothetical protein